MLDHVRVDGAREHNLKGVSLAIPRDALVVFTGVSGSGKSSLAYDTLYKEGQRRFIQSLSAYARQFLGQMERPAVDRIEGLSPAVAIDQKTRGRNPRSTVSTITEIWDHLRLLYARLGTPHCPTCGVAIEGQSAQRIAERLVADHAGRACLVLAPIVLERKGEYRKELERALADGFTRARIDGVVRRLDEPVALARFEKHTIEIVQDRLVVSDAARGRLVEAIAGALAIANGVVRFLLDDADLVTASQHLACPSCGTSVGELEPRLFSFNDQMGACARCEGLGEATSIDPARLVPDASKSIKAFALAPMRTKIVQRSTPWKPKTLAALEKAGIRTDIAWQSLPEKDRRAVLHGRAGLDLPGIVPALEALYARTDLFGNRQALARYLRHATCPECAGSRLGPLPRAVRFRGRGIADVHGSTVSDALTWMRALELEGAEAQVGAVLRKELLHRLEFLDAVGLSYLALDRSAATLSGGESQRIRLASQLGARLRGVTYILDEPSIGLHPRDNRQLIDTLAALRDQGNTVFVIEHDEEMIRAADHVVDLGPGAGEHGGHLVFDGPPAMLALAEDSLTGRYLQGTARISPPATRRAGDGPALEVKGAAHHNLKDVDARFPLGTFVAVTGVSGSGKSSLVQDILHRELARRLHGATEAAGAHAAFLGIEHVDKVIEIDQDPIGRTPRSNPATYTKVFDLIRDLFAMLPEARARGWGKGRFSFNVKGGRCETCEGAGVLVVEMQFLADVHVPCTECGGRRYHADTLEVHYRDKSIRDVLELTIAEARELFAPLPKIGKILATLEEVGMGYLRLGQPATTLSGGEAQRVKLAKELARPATGRTVYLLDEPTTGLHFADVARLIDCIQRLVDAGNTVIVVEHNLDVVQCADWVIDLGPEGGAGGGEVLYQGPLEGLVHHPTSHTARALAAHLGVARTAPRTKGKRTAKATRGSGDASRLVAGDGRAIEVVGARQHNLKGIALSIPHGTFTVVSGPSGSGKSSLVFDTLFAEGQRRFVESLSTYARRFLSRMDRPPVDSLSGLAPAIAIDQKNSSRNPRSTVATTTEISDYLRLMYARLGVEHCLVCDAPMAARPPSVAAAELVAGDLAGRTVEIGAPLFLPGRGGGMLRGTGGLREAARELVAGGHRRARVADELVALDALPAKLPAGAAVHLVLDRIEVTAKRRARLVEAIEAAYRFKGALASIRVEGEPVRLVSPAFGCATCDHWPAGELTPRMMSFNSWEGACATCAGLGEVESRGATHPCPTCDGARLKPRPLAVRVAGLGLAAACRMRIDEAALWVDTLPAAFPGGASRIATPLVTGIATRLAFLMDVGLEYLALDRRASTLSGGEAQRIRLATQIGNQLVGVLYCLDEPTIGLHPRDTARLTAALLRLRDLGNTVVVVEHDLETIRAADHLIDLGPGAGEHGGYVVAQGTVAEVARTRSPTGRYLSGAARIPRPAARRVARSWLAITNATLHNLRGVDVRFPLGAFTVVTGVSGSGKSSLVEGVLVAGLANALPRRKAPVGPFASVTGWEPLMRLRVIDQQPLSGTPRASIATYLGIFDEVRTRFATTAQAKVAGFDKSRFSYNLAAGQCAACKGLGSIQIEMHFISDVWLVCPECKGRRYGEATLAVRWRGRSIAEVLGLSVEDARVAFADVPKLARPLELMDEIGLGYLRLGQGLDALSGGEAQRLRLAAELFEGRSKDEPTLFALDEPTTGLHLDDVARLLGVLQRLVDAGHTVVAVEHHPDVIACADYVIDLGPEAGEGGGRVVAVGTPEALAACEASHTGQALKGVLGSA